MNNISEGIGEKLCFAIKEKFTPILFQKIDSLIEFINIISDLRESFPDYNENLVINNLEKVKELTDELNSLVNQQFPKRPSVSFNQTFPLFIDSISSIINALDIELKTEQNEERFLPVYGDDQYVKILKKLKYFFYIIYTYYLKSLNYILRKLNRESRIIRYWFHTVPLRNLGLHYLRDGLLKELSRIYEDVCRKYSKTAISVWEVDDKYDHYFINNFIPFEDRIEVKSNASTLEQLIKDLVDFKEEVAAKTAGVVGECIEEFNSACEKAGTVELWKIKFADSRIVKAHNQRISDFEKIITEWNNNHYALGEEWKLNCDLQSIRYSALRVFFKFEKSLSIKIKIQILPPFYDVASALENILLKISEGSVDTIEFVSLLKAIKGKIQEELLASTLPGLIVTVSGMQMPEMIDNAEKEIKDMIESMTGVRVFVNTDNYNFRFASGELDLIFPRELISVRSLPLLKEDFSKIKSYLLSELEKVQAELINLGNMVDFSIESAITALTAKELTENEVKEMALEGMKLSYGKNEEIRKFHQNICDEVVKGINKSILSFNKEVYSFTQVSKINSVRIYLARANAKLNARQEWDKIYSSIINFAPKLLTSFIKFFKDDSGVYPDAEEKLNMTEKNDRTSNKVLDYLARLNSSVEKIPYIYRRLFQLKPLENERLYVQRKEEESQLQNAFNTWIKGEYAPVILTTEKGDGITSFINVVTPKFSEQISLSRIIIKPTIDTEDKLLRLFYLILNTDTISDHNELIKIFNTLKSKRIIVIENLQHLFLRTVGGFRCINILMEIISKTNKNVFWITASTNYAFEYLNKAAKLDDYFAYHINFRGISNRQMTDLIKRRNAISGYNLQFETNAYRAGGREFSKLPENEAQKLLEKDFFISLHHYTQSNISLAFLFWLRAIKEIQERTLLIKPKLEIDNSILESLSSEKTFILQSLVLHDGLKIDEIQKTVSYSLNKTNLLVQVLSDDGIVIIEDDTYYINPLLYRQTIELLKSKNLMV